MDKFEEGVRAQPLNTSMKLPGLVLFFVVSISASDVRNEPQKSVDARSNCWKFLRRRRIVPTSATTFCPRSSVCSLVLFEPKVLEQKNEPVSLEPKVLEQKNEPVSLELDAHIIRLIKIADLLKDFLCKSVNVVKLKNIIGDETITKLVWNILNSNELGSLSIEHCFFHPISPINKFYSTINNLTLSHTNLNSREISQILSRVSADSIRKIELSFCNLSNPIQIAKELSRFVGLEELNLKYCKLNNDNVTPIFDAIFIMPKLKRLNLSGNQIAQSLLSVLNDKKNILWNELYLFDCTFSEEEIKELVNFQKKSSNSFNFHLFGSTNERHLIQQNNPPYWPPIVFDLTKPIVIPVSNFEIISIPTLPTEESFNRLPLLLKRLPLLREVNFGFISHFNLTEQYDSVEKISWSYANAVNPEFIAKVVLNLLKSFPFIKRFDFAQRLRVPCWIKHFLEEKKQEQFSNLESISLRGLKSKSNLIFSFISLFNKIKYVELSNCLFEEEEEEENEMKKKESELKLKKENSSVSFLYCQWNPNSHPNSFFNLLDNFNSLIKLRLECVPKKQIYQLIDCLSKQKNLIEFSIDGEFDIGSLIKLSVQLEKMPSLRLVRITLSQNQIQLWSHLFDFLSTRVTVLIDISSK